MPSIYKTAIKPMLLEKSSVRRLASAIALTGCLFTGVQALTLADTLPGLTIFSGVERQNQLSFRLDYGKRDMWDRYRLRIPGNKLKAKAIQFNITYPDYYTGKFDRDSIEVRVNNKALPLQQVTWDKENHSLQIYLKEPLEPGKSVELVLNNVKNPDFGGTYYFNASVLSLGDVPLPNYLGTWILSID